MRRIRSRAIAALVATFLALGLLGSVANAASFAYFTYVPEDPPPSFAE